MTPLLTAIQSNAVASNQLRSLGLSDVGMSDLGVSDLGVSDMVRMECLFYPHSVLLMPATSSGRHAESHPFQRHEDHSSATDSGLGTERGSQDGPLSKNETGAPAKPGRRSSSSSS